MIANIVTNHSPDNEVTRDVVYGEPHASHTFVSIPITGMIVGDESDVAGPVGFLSEQVTYGYEVKSKLRKLALDENVDGIVLEINSPGGTIYGAKAIADGVADYQQKTKKPVISFVSGLAASGAYWSAISTDEVIADAGTSVGSIGVISGPFQYYDTVIAENGGLLAGGVVTQKGIETTYITAGRSKDFGNPYRRLTKDEIDSMQAMVNNEYDSFVSYVASRRGIPKETIVTTLGALLYDTKTAKEQHMIDTMANREEAYVELAKKANVPLDDFSVSQEHPRKGLLMNILSAKGFISPVKSEASLCGLTKVHLVYHGDVSSLCN